MAETKIKKPAQIPAPKWVFMEALIIMAGQW
jgi:hypothetical protein